MLLRFIAGLGGDLARFLGPFVDELGNFVCSLVSNPEAVKIAVTATAVAQGVPPQQAAGAASQISSMAQRECADKPPDCKNPANAKLVQCLPVKPPLVISTPWWQSWYVVVPVVAALGYVVLSKKKV
jgi:hypothetical protein